MSASPSPSTSEPGEAGTPAVFCTEGAVLACDAKESCVVTALGGVVEWVTNAPGKFIASMRDLIQAFGTTEASTDDQKVIKTLLKPDSDGQMVIPLLRAMPKLMAESQETGVPAVLMTRGWWEGTIKPQLQVAGLMNEYPKAPEMHQLVSDHVYTKVRVQMLVNFLEAL